MLADGATAPRRGDRPRHRVVPQRLVARLQDLGGDTRGAHGPVPAARGGAGRPRRRRLADGRAGGRRRPGLGRGAGGRRTPRSSRSPSGRPTRTWASACGASASCRSTAGAARSSTRPGVEAKFGVPPVVDARLARRWSATAPTATPACPGSGRRRRPRSSGATGTSTTSRSTRLGRRGAGRRHAGRDPGRPTDHARLFSTWPRSVWTGRCSMTWPRCGGKVRTTEFGDVCRSLDAEQLAKRAMSLSTA